MILMLQLFLIFGYYIPESSGSVCWLFFPDVLHELCSDLPSCCFCFYSMKPAIEVTTSIGFVNVSVMKRCLFAAQPTTWSTSPWCKAHTHNFCALTFLFMTRRRSCGSAARNSVLRVRTLTNTSQSKSVMKRTVQGFTIDIELDSRRRRAPIRTPFICPPCVQLEFDEKEFAFVLSRPTCN